MHDDHVFLSPGQDGVVDAIGVLDLKPLLLACEPLLLNPSNIQYIRVTEHFVERLADSDRDAGLSRSGDHAGWHGKRRRRYEVETHGVEAQKGDEAMHSAPILQVAKKGDSASVDGTKLRTNGVDV